MNLFRMLGEMQELGINGPRMLTAVRGLVPSFVHPDSSAQDEDDECTSIATPKFTACILTYFQSAAGISFKSQFLYLIVYLTRYLDLLWTFYIPHALYNTVFKIVFISTSSYTVYLMLNDFKPTHDPNLDTFKVQYLLAASALLAVVFPYQYSVSEVSGNSKVQAVALLIGSADTLGLLHLAGIGSDFAPAVHVAEDWRGRDNHHALSVCARCISCAVHSQLDLEVLFGYTALLRPNCSDCRYCPDDSVLGLLLHLLHKVSRPPQSPHHVC
jgi:hypothetical protein